MPRAALNHAEITAISRVSEPAPSTRRRPNAGPINILLVEDDASDTVLTEIALDATGIHYDLLRIDNGSDVLPYLRSTGKYRSRRRPDMLLLDLGLPQKNGFEILADMAADTAQFCDLPIVILTGDPHSTFLRYAYGLNIAAYITKPCSDDKLLRAFARMRHF